MAKTMHYDCKKNIIKISISLILAIVVLPGASYAQPKAIDLPKLIEVFMVEPNSNPKWSMGASASTSQIAWKTIGVDEHPRCGTYQSCRRGRARVLLNGKEMQHLRQYLEPVPWNLLMVSRSFAKFGPEQIEIAPFCDTVECSFDFEKAMRNKGYILEQLCKAEPNDFKQTAYRITKGSKQINAVVANHAGSGGHSTDLTLFFKSSTRPDYFCSEAKSIE